jgi:hypothetical protein
METAVVSGGRFQTARLRDVSLGGAFVEVPTAPPIGTTLRMTLPPLPGTDGRRESVEARVVRVVDVASSGPEHRVGLGLELKLTAAQRERLGVLLSRPPDAARSVSLGRITLSHGGGRAAPGRAGRYLQSLGFRLAQMRRGEVRAVRLRLSAERGGTAQPTPYHLDLRVSCDVPERLFYLDARVDFGEARPQAVALTVLRNGRAVATGIPVVAFHVASERGLALELTPEAETVSFVLEPDEESGLPPMLAAELRVREEPNRAPTPVAGVLAAPLRAALIEAFSRALSPSLNVLGQLMSSGESGTRLHLLGMLVEQCAPLELIEAAAAEVRETFVAGPDGIRHPSSSLDLNDPAHAALVVFDPETPPYLVNQAFAVAFGSLMECGGTPRGRLWKQIARTAAAYLARRAPELLEEDGDAVACGIDEEAAFVLRLIIDRAGKTAGGPGEDSRVPTEVLLGTVAKGSRDEAEAAAIALLARVGRVRRSVGSGGS